ncbi:MAG: response regulator [Candidatus Firestonebacteria bacterium]
MKRILIIDDDTDITFILQQALANLGYEAIVASDGEEGLEKLFSSNFDLVVLDIMMPKLDGYSLTVKLRENEKTKDVPVIIISGRGQLYKLFSSTGKTKIDCYIEKPFKIQVLIGKIKAIFGEK